MRRGQRESRELHCPFCSRLLPRPVEIQLSSFESAEGGTCECGAIYLADTTGKNVGEIMLKALTMMADSLSTDVTELNCGEDYDEVILSYDWRTHRSSGASRGFGGGQGSMYIVKPRAKSA